MQKGYLKLAMLFALTKGPLHGYQAIKRINELTLGVITPTAGGVYPALRELKEEGLIKGEWMPEKRRKVYEITEKGKEVFKKAVEKHFELASSIRSWILKGLADLKIVEEVELPSVMMPVVRVLLLDEKASAEERIKALEKLSAELQHLAILLYKMTDHIIQRIEELKSSKNERFTTI